jgi:hypothetical protein
MFERGLDRITLGAVAGAQRRVELAKLGAGAPMILQGS